MIQFPPIERHGHVWRAWIKPGVVYVESDDRAKVQRELVRTLAALEHVEEIERLEERAA